jgi:uncharacterized repeat protein (TIGR01451 family)
MQVRKLNARFFALRPSNYSGVSMANSPRVGIRQTQVLIVTCLNLIASTGVVHAQWLPLCPLELLAPHMREPPVAVPPEMGRWPAPTPQMGQWPAPAAGPVQDPPTPSVTIHVRVADHVASGRELEYRLHVENNSSAPAHHVLVRNPLPGNAKFVRASPEPYARAPELLWRLGTLEPGARQEIVLTLVPTGGQEINNCARVQFEHGQCVRTKIDRPSIQLRKDGPSKALVNQTLNYKITVTNTGGSELTNVMLADVLPAGLEHSSGKNRLSWIVAALAPGQSQSIDYQLIAKATGRLCNKTIATAAGELREERENCVAVTEPKLGLTMTGPRARYLNMPAGYEITVSNPGTEPLTDVVLADSLPAQTTFVSASDGVQPTGSQVQWSIGTLEPGNSRTVELVLRAQAAGRICNQAIASASHGLTKEAEVCTEFSGLPALSLSVEDTTDPVEVGGTTGYTITVRNPGSKPATNVRIAATVPDQEEVTRAAGASDNRKEGRRILYEPLTLQAGGEALYYVEVKALRPGDVRFRVELTADQLTGGPVQQEESTTIYAVLPSSRLKASKRGTAGSGRKG